MQRLGHALAHMVLALRDHRRRSRRLVGRVAIGSRKSSGRDRRRWDCRRDPWGMPFTKVTPIEPPIERIAVVSDGVVAAQGDSSTSAAITSFCRALSAAIGLGSIAVQPNRLQTIQVGAAAPRSRHRTPRAAPPCRAPRCRPRWPRHEPPDLTLQAHRPRTCQVDPPGRDRESRHCCRVSFEPLPLLVEVTPDFLHRRLPLVIDT